MKPREIAEQIAAATGCMNRVDEIEQAVSVAVMSERDRCKRMVASLTGIAPGESWDAAIRNAVVAIDFLPLDYQVAGHYGDAEKEHMADKTCCPAKGEAK